MNSREVDLKRDEGDYMIARAFPFTATGLLKSGQTYICGASIAGFTQIDIYNGSDANGEFVARCSGDGEHHFGYEINCTNGLYVQVTGGPGKAAVWLV